jgi:hypothetical protein
MASPGGSSATPSCRGDTRRGVHFPADCGGGPRRSRCLNELRRRCGWGRTVCRHCPTRPSPMLATAPNIGPKQRSLDALPSPSSFGFSDPRMGGAYFRLVEWANIDSFSRSIENAVSALPPSGGSRPRGSDGRFCASPPGPPTFSTTCGLGDLGGEILSPLRKCLA